MPDLSPVNPGQPLRRASASRTNALLATAREDQGLPATELLKDAGHHRWDNTHILVKNDSGRRLKRYALCGIDEPVWLPGTGDGWDIPETDTGNNIADWVLRSSPVFSISWPGGGDVHPWNGATLQSELGVRYRARYCVLEQPLAPCQIGWARVSAMAFLRVAEKLNPGRRLEVSTDPAHAVEDYLVSSANGSAQVIWTGPGSRKINRQDSTVCGQSLWKCSSSGNSWQAMTPCDEGCGINDCWEGGVLQSYGLTVPCTPNEERTVDCCGNEEFNWAMVRLSNGLNLLADVCYVRNCRYECTETADVWSWSLVSQNCLSEPEDVLQCECPTDEYVNLNVLPPASAAQACRTLILPCQSVPPTTEFPPTTLPPTTEACEGCCGYSCFADMSGDYSWHLFGPGDFLGCATCTGLGCECFDPNSDPAGYPCGPPNDGGIVGPFPCVLTTPPPTTEPPTTSPPTTLPPTTAPPTTEPPCEGSCNFEWNGAAWVQQIDSCTAGVQCQCCDPTAGGDYPGQPITCGCAPFPPTGCGACVPTTAAPTTTPPTTAAPTTTPPTTAAP